MDDQTRTTSVENKFSAEYQRAYTVIVTRTEYETKRFKRFNTVCRPKPEPTYNPQSTSLYVSNTNTIIPTKLPTVQSLVRRRAFFFTKTPRATTQPHFRNGSLLDKHPPSGPSTGLNVIPTTNLESPKESRANIDQYIFIGHAEIHTGRARTLYRCGRVHVVLLPCDTR